MCLNVAYSKVQSWRYLSVTFSTQNGLKEGHDVLLLLCNFDFKNIRRDRNLTGQMSFWSSTVLVTQECVSGG